MTGTDAATAAAPPAPHHAATTPTAPDLSVSHDGPVPPATAPAANPTLTAASLVTATVVAGAVAAAATEALAPAPVPRQRLRGRRRPAPAPVPLGSLTQREHRHAVGCASCGSASVTSLSMTLADGTPARFASCRTCGHRTWEGDDGVISVGEVLARSTRDPR